MHRRTRRSRVFALIWAVLQFALPASATFADARFAGTSLRRAHVEEAPGRDCAPSHSPDCAICKHISASSLGSTHVAAAFVSDGSGAVVLGRIDPAPQTPAGIALPRAPPTHA